MDKEEVRRVLRASGCVAVGFSEAAEVDATVIKTLGEWVGDGKNAGMEYMMRHVALKRNPENVLPGVRTVISLAFSFNPAEWRDPSLPSIASYAYGDDYHDVLRDRLRPLTEKLKQDLGGEWRICIDSAPVAERYWAMKSGIGYIGRNGMIIVDGYGSMVFLAEVLTTVAFPPDHSVKKTCEGCGRCVAACPGKALAEDGTIDCRRCLSYLTIEHKGEWPVGSEMEMAMHTPAGRNTLFGCDRCLSVCPHNSAVAPTSIHEFSLRPSYSLLTAQNLKGGEWLNQGNFADIFRQSAIKRCRLKGFDRNVANLE